MRFLLILLLIPQLAHAKNVFVSSPFDNFRIECPKRAGATELSIRMVESVGAKRQDIVFDLTCEQVENLYPWVNIPVGISEMEREDCYYSPMFDPILNSKTEFSCKEREYIAGITRLTDTRIQIMCCRLRSRAEFECQETAFNKPIGLSRSTIIERQNKLLNGIRIEDRGYVVRFCDLAPRSIPEIYNDVKATTVKVVTTPKPNNKQHKVSKTTRTPTTPRPVSRTTHRASVTRTIPSTTTRAATTRVATTRVTRPRTTPSTTRMTTTRARTTPSSTRAPTTATTHVRPHSSGQQIVSKSDMFGNTIPEYTPSKEPNLQRVTTRIPTTAETPKVTIAMPRHHAEVQHAVPVTTQRPPTKLPTETERPAETSQEMEQIIRTIENASSEKIASDLFKKTVTSLLENQTQLTATAASPPAHQEAARPSEQPAVTNPVQRAQHPHTMDVSSKLNHGLVNNDERRVATTPNTVDTTVQQNPAKSIEDITMVGDLSRVTFNNDAFPKPHEKKVAVPGKLKFSKNNLPLRSGSDGSDFVFLQPINADGRRRSPMRPYRPHISLWSEEDDEMTELFGSMEFGTDDTDSKRARTHRKKVIRAHRLPAPTDSQEVVIASSEHAPSSEELTNNSVGMPEREELFIREEQHVSEPSSSRRDLPVQRKVGKFAPIIEQTDNAGFVDEELSSSPFDNEQSASVDQTTENPTLAQYDKARFEFQDDEDIEDVVNKLIARTAEIRRAPVRNTAPRETQGEKTGENESLEMVSRNMKDGVKTYPKPGPPMDVPEITIFDNKFKVDKYAEHETIPNEKGDEMVVTEDLVPMESPMFVGWTDSITENAASSGSESTTGNSVTEGTPEATTSSAPFTSTAKITVATTIYDPNAFYHTPKPKPAKKEKILTFCTKDVAIRDERNMVVACGGEQDIWTPNRCPEGTDCFLSHDSTYRICCPVSRG